MQDQGRCHETNNNRLSLDENVLGQLEKVLNEQYNPQMAQKVINFLYSLKIPFKIIFRYKPNFD